VLSIRPQLVLPKSMLDDLHKFISFNYPKHLPHPLLIAQSFMLKFPKYGNEIGLTAISDAVEYLKNNRSF
jgi:hypothetical protein